MHSNYFEFDVVVMQIKKKLTLRAWILQDPCQAVSCDASAQNDATMQFDFVDLYVLDV